MEYIKSRVEVVTYRPFPERIEHFLCETGNPSEFFARGIPTQKMAFEIAAVLNEHDPLVARCAALAAACKDLVDAIEEGWDDLYVEQSVEAGHAALALVKGDQ